MIFLAYQSRTMTRYTQPRAGIRNFVMSIPSTGVGAWPWAWPGSFGGLRPFPLDREPSLFHEARDAFLVHQQAFAIPRQATPAESPRRDAPWCSRESARADPPPIAPRPVRPRRSCREA